MKELGPRLGEIEIFRRKEGVCPTLVKKGAATGRLDRHYIGVGGRRGCCETQLGDVNSVGPAIVVDESAAGVVSH